MQVKLKAPAGAWLEHADAYVYADEVLGHAVPLSDRVQLWSSVPMGQALTLISSMLKDLDLPGAAAPAEAGWVAQVSSAELLSGLQAALRDQRRVLAPQLLLLALIEALDHCPAGDPTGDFTGLEEIFQCVLGIAGEADAPRAGEDWGTLDSGLAAELVAQHYFGHTADPIDQLSWIHANWRTPWSRPTVKDELIAQAGGEPGELFAEATDIEFDDFASVGVHLWVQADQNGFVRFPSDFFDRLGVDRAAADRFLDETSTDVDTLKQAIADERARTGGSRWAFHALRRWPIVRLENGEWLVLRLGFMIERALGDVTYWDVRNYLKAEDESKGSKRDAGFRGCLGFELEANVGAALGRMFPGVFKLRRLHDEKAMQHSWATKGQMPSVCDFAVDCGDTWLLFDVTDRRVPEKLINATASAGDLDAELGMVLTAKKAKQFASTMKLLNTEFGKLVKGHGTPPTRFVCIVITPAGGLGWNPAINVRTQELLAGMGALQSAKALPLAIMSVRDLTELESAVENGRAAHEILTDWRVNGPGFSFEQFLVQRRIPLMRSRWVQDSAMRAIGELIERIESYESDR